MKNLRLVITGFTMGVADLVPGVSGGSIALLFGIYDELLKSIKFVTNDAVKLILSGKLKDAWSLIPFKFLLPVFSGIVVAIFGFVRVVEYLLETFPIFVWSLFFGLIIGTAYIISKRVESWSLRRIWLATLGAVIVFIITGLPAVSGTATVLTMLATGAIAICAMILPGISGSLIMLILGQYENVIEAVSEFKAQLLISFVLGAAVGLALFSTLLSWLLDKYHYATMAVLVGLMIGALRAVWPWRIELESGLYESYLPYLSPETYMGLLFMLIGIGIVLMLERAGLAREHDDL